MGDAFREPAKDNAAPPAGTEKPLSCPYCNYTLRGMLWPVCPGCGIAFTWEGENAGWPDASGIDAAGLSEAAHEPVNIDVNSGGLAEDLPCPRCKYNLHGMTRPICPECGFIFTWADIPAMRKPKPKKDFVGRVFAISIVLTAFATFLGDGGVSLLIVLMLCSALQAVMEFAIVIACLREATELRIRDWWKGVVIGQAVAVDTLLALGFTLAISGPYRSFVEGWDVHWPKLIVVIVETALVQYGIMRWTVAQRAKPTGRGRWFAACLLAKTVTTIAWMVLVPLGLRRVFS